MVRFHRGSALDMPFDGAYSMNISDRGPLGPHGGRELQSGQLVPIEVRCVKGTGEAP
jgi:hypothetical protein